MKNKQGFSSVALIIIAVLVLGGGYWAWQKENNKIPHPITNTDEQVDTVNNINIEPPVPSTPSVDMANWKTYRNDKYGFEFKYPSSWEQCWYAGNDVGFYPKHLLCLEEPRSGNYDSVFGPNRLELALVNAEFKNISNIDQLKAYLETVSVGSDFPKIKSRIGGASFLTTKGCDAGCTYNHFVFLKEGVLLNVLYGENSEGNFRNQILSTFRFTK